MYVRPKANDLNTIASALGLSCIIFQCCRTTITAVVAYRFCCRRRRELKKTRRDWKLQFSKGQPQIYFQQKRLWALKISIWSLSSFIYLNSTKIRVFSPNFDFFGTKILQQEKRNRDEAWVLTVFLPSPRGPFPLPVTPRVVVVV